MGATRADRAASENAEAIEAWDGPLFDRFVEFKDVLTTNLGRTATVRSSSCRRSPAERVVDIGCGFGDATQQIAALVGPEGEVLGVDAAPRFIEACIDEARAPA